MLVPATTPGTVDPRVAQSLQPRWSRSRRLLLGAFAGGPVGVVLLCAASVVTAGVTDGFTWWSPLPVVGAAIPACTLLVAVRGLVFTPPRWPKAAFLTGGCQLLLGVFPAIGTATSAGGVAAVVATATFVLSLAAVGLGVVAVVRAARILLTPLSAQLGATPFAVAVRARLADTGMVAGSVVLAEDRVEWSARQHRATGRGSADFAAIRGARTVTAQPVPWLRLSDGVVVHTTPGPAVVLDTHTGDVLLPVHDPTLFVELLNTRMTAWYQAQQR